MKFITLAALLMLSGCADTQYPEVVTVAEQQCISKGGVNVSFVNAYQDSYRVDTHCKDGTLISYNLKRPER